MQFLDLTGLRELWAKIKAGDAKATTTVQGQSASGNDAYVSAAGTAQEGEGQDGHINYVITLHNAASNADVAAAKQELYGGSSIPAENPLTLTNLDSRIDKLETGSSVAITEAAGSGDVLKSYTFTQNGNNIGVINIPKDFLVKSGSVREAGADDTDIAVGTKVLDFVVNSVDGAGSESHIVIPVSDLVDVYTGGNGIAVSSANVISAVVDPTSENFLTLDTAGLKVSGVQTAINNAKAEVLGASTDAASANTVYGAKAYADSLAGNYATAAQGTLADTAIQSVTGESGEALNNPDLVKVAASTTDKAVTITSTVKTQAISTADASTADGLAVASDVKSYVDTAVSGKNVDAEGDSLVSATAANNKVTVAATSDLTSAVNKANSAIQSVKVNGAALTPDANKAVDVLIAEGATNGTIAVNGSDIPVHGLDSAAYTPSTAYATAAQGTKADGALQSVSHGTDGSYVTTTIGAKADNDQAISVAVKVQPMNTASDSAAETMGLAEASDVKNYIDSQAASGLSAIQSVSGENAVTAGDFIEVSVEAATSNKAVTLTSHANVTTKAVASATSSDNGLATAYDVKTYVDNATGALDSSIAANSITNKSANSVEAEPETYVFTGIQIVDGALAPDAAGTTSVRIMGIPSATLDTILR